MTIESNEKLRRMIRDLGRTLAEAISDSSEASRTLRQLHEEGYAISLALGHSRNGDSQEKLTVSLEKRGSRGPLQPADAPEPAEREVASPQTAGSRQPVFRIHSRDLAFLRSVGIDPTRRPRRRR